MTIRKYTLLTVLLVMLSGCKGFLGNVPKGYQIPQKVEEFDLLLNGEDLLTYGASFLDLMVDQAHIPGSLPPEYMQINLTYGMSESWRRMYLYDDYFYEPNKDDQIYVNGYKRIFIYNAIIEGLKDATGDDKERSRVRAEALAGRAFEYLMLVTVYAPPYDKERASQALAVPLNLSDDINKQDLPIATQQEVWDQIFSDLDEALPALPEKPTTNAYRMSRTAGYALYARAAFLTHQYDLALEYAKKALQGNDALLDMKPLTLNVNEWAAGERNNYPEALTNPESIYIRHFLPYIGLSEYLLVGQRALALYGDEPEKDMRYFLFITDIPGGTPEANPEGEFTWNPAVEFNIGLSTPEMYLIAAECEARKGMIAEPLARLNALRAQRIHDYTPLNISDKKELISTIIAEREREYLLRGYYRYMDLKRLATDSEFAVTVTHYDVDGKAVVADPKSPDYLKHPLPYIVLEGRGE
ncbi:MAG: RagB/SusD family nutrient uptake outer membrane protein [Porphyromonas sp.]|nr:RagB/SusD family nutrient uptake outer membrane protein [Porphyromonas sp.]